MENNKPPVELSAVADWLQSHYGGAVSGLTPLAGGFWSAAFAYEWAGAELVVRFNATPDGFQIDQAAYEFASAGLPIPEVLELGEALGCCFAISRRHHGQFLELTKPSAAPALEGAIDDLLRKMRQVPSRERVQWYATESDLTWHEYLLRAIESHSDRPQNDFQAALAERPALSSLYDTTCQQIRALLAYCPERRDLVHGDLLHQNVLVSSAADEVTAVFSWKCSTFGDFVYDLAWCTHWAPWHPGIAACDLFGLTLKADDLDETDRLHIAERHHCYELQIAASHVGWYLWTGDEENLALLTEGLQERLDRGPLTIS